MIWEVLCQGSSVVERGTHNAEVVGSFPTPDIQQGIKEHFRYQSANITNEKIKTETTLDTGLAQAFR